MRPASSKKYVFVEKQQQSYDLTPQKKPPPPKRQSQAPRNQRIIQQAPTSKGKLMDNKLYNNPQPSVPRHRKQVDVLKYANDIVQKARKIDVNQSPSKELNWQSPKNDISTKPSKPTEQPPQQPPPTSKPVKQSQSEQQPPPSVPLLPSKNSLPESSNNARENKLTKEFELRQKQMMSKIDFLEQQVQSSTKDFQQMQTKYNTIVKQHKSCTKQIKRLSQSLKEKQGEMVKLLQRDDIPYDRKRECILQSQLRNMKEYNRELTLRLKAYKGSELSEMAVQFNKVNVLNDYVKEKYIDDNALKLELQSLAFQLLKDLDGYVVSKTKKKLTFADEQKYLIGLQKSIMTFCMNCLIQGIRLPDQPNQNVQNVSIQQAVRKECDATRLLSDYDISVKNTEFNMKVCRDLTIVMEDQQQLTTYLSKSNVRKVLQDCFNTKGKRLADISKAVEDKLLVYVDRHTRFIFVLLAVITSTLARHDVLNSYLTETINRTQSELKRLSKPLEDLHSLYQYGGQSNDQSYLNKLSMFVSNNIDTLRVSIPALNDKLNNNLIDFAKLRNLV